MGDDLFDLDGKVALVTGASRGLGAAMAVALATAGAQVALHASERPCADTAATIEKIRSGSTRCVIANLADRAAVDCLVPDVLTAFGRLDIVVNNAGIIRRQPAAQHTDAFWDEVIEINLTSMFRLSRAAATHMIDRREGGKIINVASLLSFQGGINVPGYAAAKGGVAQLTRALANEWAPHGINVNAIAPGYMKTDNTRALQDDPVRSKQILERIPAGRWGAPQDLAGAALFLASRASDYVHGHVLVVDGGWMGR